MGIIECLGLIGTAAVIGGLIGRALFDRVNGDIDLIFGDLPDLPPELMGMAADRGSSRGGEAGCDAADRRYRPSRTHGAEGR